MPKPKLRLRDWLFGGGGKRRLMHALVADETRAWSQVELARAAGLKEHGSVDGYLVALDQLGLLARGADGRYRLKADNALVAPLRQLVAAIEAVSDEELRRAP